MFKIGDFSRITSISIRMLRYYDQNDILKPRFIDMETGYRYYEREQIFMASQIALLRDIGFGTAMIKEILTHYQNTQEIHNFLEMRLLELKDEATLVESRIKQVSKMMQILNKEEIIMKYEVSIKTIPGIYAVTKRGIIPNYTKEGLMWEGLQSELQATKMNVQNTVDGQARCYFYDEGYKDSDVDVEIAMSIQAGNHQDTENIVFKQLPSVKVAAITFQGDYSQCTDVSMALAAWFGEHDYEIDGCQFAIYHVGYLQNQNPAEFITEICWPIK